MTKKDKQTLSKMSSVNRFMLSVASDSRGYGGTEMTVRTFFRHYRGFCKSNDLKDCLKLPDFARALSDYGIKCSVRDATLPFEMRDMPALREILISDLGLNKKFFKDDASLAAAIGERSTGIAGDFTL